MRRVVTGEELAQLYNPDPFAMPRWRAPVYRTPLGIILAAKLFKLLGWLIRMVARHPVAASALATNVHRLGHAAFGFGRPQRCWRSLRTRARSRRWAARTSGWRALALRQRR